MPFVSHIWQPNRLPNLFIDLNADLVPGADGTKISLWSNQAPTGTAYDYTQSGSTTLQPTLKKHILNGHAGMLSDGLNTFMTTGTDITSAAKTVFIVAKMTSATATTYLCDVRSSVPSQNFFAMTTTGSTWNIEGQAVVTTNKATVSAGAIDTNAHVFSIGYNGVDTTATSSYTFAINGVNQTLSAGGLDHYDNNDKSGLFAYASAAGGHSNSFPGYIFRFLVYNRLLSFQENALVTKYLRNIYGL